MKKVLGTIMNYVALATVILGSTPLAYAGEIKKVIDQSQSEKYYQETIDSAEQSVIPNDHSQPESDSAKDSANETNTNFDEHENLNSSTEVGSQAASDGSQSKVTNGYDIRLPDVEEQKQNDEEKSLRSKYGEPIVVNGQEQIYKKDDRHFITYISGEAKTFKSTEGLEIPMDLSLKTGSDEGKTVFKPTGSPVEVILPAKVDHSNGIKVSKNEETLELIPMDKTYENATVKENAILYNNVDEADDIQYTITDSGVKEEIILDSWREKHQFSYHFSSEGYSASLEGNQVIVTKKDQKEILFVLSAPIMIDSAGETSDDIKLALTEKPDRYELTIDASQDWLKDEKRAYPVRIDPTVTVPTESLIDTVTSSVHGTYQGRGYGYVGYITQEMTGIWNAKDVGRTRIYSKINYDFSRIPKEAKIDNATYNLYQYIQYPQTNATFASFKLKEDFNIDTLTWDNSVGLAQEPTGENAISAAKHGMHNFDIRDAVNSWVNGTSKNYGIVIQATNENDYGGAFYTTYSTGTAGQVDFSPDKRPSITINWSIPDPVEMNYPLENTTVALRSMMLTDKHGKLQLQGVLADGLTTPGAIVQYELSDKGKEFSGESFASYSYKYPNSSLFDFNFPNGTTKYNDKLSNWQTGLPFINPDFNKVYTIDAESKKDGLSSGKKTSEKFIAYKVTQYDTLPKIAAYYGVPLAQIVFDNRVQDMLLLSNNTIFIRNPKKNADMPYNPPKLTDGTKQDIDSLLMGRGLHCEFGFEPINLNTGNFYLDRTDVSIPSLTSDFEITRFYNSKGAEINSLFGRGWSFAFNEQVTSDENGNLYYTRTDGSILKFTKDGENYLAPDGYDLSMSVIEKESKEADFGNGQESYSVKEYQITDNNHQKKVFNYFGLLTNQIDEKGNVTKLDYNSNAQLTAITDPTGKLYNIAMNEDGYIGSISVPNGGKLSYEYDEKGHLVAFTDAVGVKTRYEYNQEGFMSAWYDGNGSKVIENLYDEQGRVVTQTDGNGAVSTLSYGDGQTKTTDAKGNITLYHYDQQFRTTSISYADGSSVLKTYNAENRLESETNEAGQETRYTYDKNGNVLTETRFDGAVKKNSYDDHNHLLTEVGFDGKKREYTYDKNWNLTEIKLNGHVEKIFESDKQGRILRSVEPNGSETVYSYSGAFLTKIVNSLGGVTTIEYDPHGLPIQMTNPLGGVGTLTYDKEGRKTSETTPDNHKTTYTFDSSGQVIAQTDGNGHTSKFTYDAIGNRLTMTNGTGGQYNYVYDTVGNKVQMIDPEGRITSYEYDVRNRLLSEKNPLGKTISYGRDKLGRVISETNENGKVTKYAFDETSNQIATIIDPLNRVTKQEYDDSGNLIKVENPDGTVVTNAYDDWGHLIKHTDEAGIVTAYEYDENGNKLSEMIGEKKTTFSYDLLGNVVKIIFPNQQTNLYTYDKMGNILSFSDSRNLKTSYAYNKAGALINITDALGNKSEITYDGNGNQASISDAAGYTTSTTYNAHNLPEMITDGLGNKTIYSYNQIEQITKSTDALGNEKKYSYNELGLPSEIIDENGNVYKLSYTATGETAKIEYPDGTAITNSYDDSDRLMKQEHSNGLVTEYEYDTNDRLIHLKDNQDLDEYYTYNTQGDRLTKTNSLGEVTTYEYDTYGDLTKVIYADQTTETFTYDLMGNVLTSTDVEGKKTSYKYDKNGNLLSTADNQDRVTTYEYDAANRVVTETNPAGGTTTYTWC